MPIPPSTDPGFEPVIGILNATRLRLHERMPSLIAFSGTVLRETEPSTHQAFNNGYRKCQAVMANAGSSTFDATIAIYGIPVVSNAALDPLTECWISKAGCSDGANQFATPALPSDLMTPQWMSERPNGSMMQLGSSRRPNMPFVADGLPKSRKTLWNGCAQWKSEAIYYPGALQSMDFWLSYQRFLSDVNDVATVPWFAQSIPISRSQEPMSYWVCREFCMSQSNNEELDPDVRQQYIVAATGFETMALAATRLLVSPDKKRKQKMNITRLPFAGGGGGGGFGGNTCGPAWTGG